jgi:hypothetical protein
MFAVLVTVGVVGFIAFLLIMGRLFFQGKNKGKRERSKGKGLGLGLLVGLGLGLGSNLLEMVVMSYCTRCSEFRLDVYTHVLFVLNRQVKTKTKTKTKT